MELRLSELPDGIWARVTAVRCGSSMQKRLRNFGLVPGTELACRYRGPGGHIAAVELKGTVVALRSADSGQITVRIP